MIPELVREDKLVQFPQSADERSPIQHAFGDTMFGVLSKDARRKKVFDDYMEARRYSKEPKWFEIFPAGEKFTGELKAGRDEPLLVDVGGGKGHDLALFRQRFPDVEGRLICQDLPATFSSLVEKPKGVELTEHDFFEPQPVKGKPKCFTPIFRDDLTFRSRRSSLLPAQHYARLAGRQMHQHSPKHCDGDGSGKKPHPDRRLRGA